MPWNSAELFYYYYYYYCLKKKRGLNFKPSDFWKEPRMWACVLEVPPYWDRPWLAERKGEVHNEYNNRERWNRNLLSLLLLIKGSDKRPADTRREPSKVESHQLSNLCHLKCRFRKTSDQQSNTTLSSWAKICAELKQDIFEKLIKCLANIEHSFFCYKIILKLPQLQWS